jgi:hypothetical protein
MYIKAEQAMYLYDKACRCEQDGEANLAEVYYLKSWFLLEQVGGMHHLTAANALNAAAFIRWARKDYEGALRLANESVKIMEAHAAKFAGADAELIRNTSWELIDQVRHQMLLDIGIR